MKYNRKTWGAGQPAERELYVPTHKPETDNAGVGSILLFF